MGGNCKLISITTISINGTTPHLKDIDQQNRLKKTGPTICCLHIFSHRQRHPQVEGKITEKYSTQMESENKKESLFSYMTSRYKAKINQKRQQRSLHSGEGNNSIRKYMSKYMCLEQQHTHTFLKILVIKCQIDFSTIKLGDLKAALSPIDKLSKHKINKGISDGNKSVNQIHQNS